MSVAGTYNVTVKTPMGDQSGTFTVNVDGDRFTGMLAGGLGTMEVQDGKVSGQTLSWKMDMKMPMPLSLDATATVDGDAINGSVKAGIFGSMAFAGVRA